MNPIDGSVLSLYRELMRGLKILESFVFVLDEHSNNVDWASTTETLHHPTITHELYFEVRERKDKAKVELKIHAHCIHQAPCFRFDTGGATHQNRYDDVPLDDQPVPPPHFQGFDDIGRWWAYHTAEMRDPQFSEALKQHIIASLDHFFHESNIETQDTRGVDVRRRFLELVTDETDESDPHYGADFT